MRKIIVCLLMAALVMMTVSIPLSFAAELQRGTVVHCKLITDISSSGSFMNNSQFQYRVTDDVVDTTGKIVIPRDTMGFGNFMSKPAGGCGSPGEVRFNAVSLQLNGKTIPVVSSSQASGSSQAGWVIPVAIVTGIFTLVGFCFLFVQGGDVLVPSGTQFDVTLDSNYSY